jgi:porphobilinogen synthase
MVTAFPFLRLRRLRQHSVLRDLIRETDLQLKDLICPLFIKGKEGNKQPISSMPGLFQIPISQLEQEINELNQLGIFSVILFGIPPHKDEVGSDAYSDEGIIQEAIRTIRKASPEMLIVSDVCCCEYTTHGHCGFLTERQGKWDVDNDKTLELLVKQALSHARAGADVVAPSGMIDGMVHAIRAGLDGAGFEHLPILSYSVKYNSVLYGPFRNAAEGAPSFGDRSTHQMDTANAREAVREADLDVSEGADMLMVKPAHAYLDVIYRVKQAHPHIPLGAYHTSGEFAMLKAAAERGWLDEQKAVLEILRGIRRAGADFIITYYAKEFAQWLKF